MHKHIPKIISRILVVIVCIISAIFISLVDLKTTINSLTIEFISDQVRSFRLYYDTGSGYNEQESVGGEVLRRDKQATTYHFPIPHDKTLIAIRIDPDEQPSRYLIKTVSVNYLYNSKRIYPHLTWNAGQIEKLFVPLHNVKPFVLQQGHLLVETEGPDPYFGTKENLSETWKRLRNEQHPLLLPLKIGSYILLALVAILFFFHQYVSTQLKKIIHLLSKAVIHRYVSVRLKKSYLLSKTVILGFIILFAISVYFILGGGGLSIGAYYLFFYWIYLTGVFFMTGWITQRLMNFMCRDLFRDIDLSQCVILGVVFLTIAAMLLHFVFPLNSTLHMVVIFSLCIFCAFDRKKMMNYCMEKLNRVGVVYQCCSATHIFLAVIIFAGFILVVLRVVYLSIGGPTEYDTTLYHAQIVRWIKEYPIVPGLGNLYHRLAYNNSFHVLASFLDIGVFQNKSFHGLNGFFFLFLQVNLLIRFWFLCRGDFRISNIFAALFILLEPFLIADIFPPTINSLSTDFPTFVLTGYIILYFIRLLEDGHLHSKGEFIIGLSITGFAATVKLVSAPLLLLPIFILVKYLKAERLQGVIKRNNRFLLILFVIIFTLFAPWATRNVILSGYIVYPVYQVDIFNPDWKMPKAMVIDESRWIQSWARVPNVYPDQVLDKGFSHWLKLWVYKQSVIPLGVIFGFHLVILSLFFTYYKNVFSMLLPIYVTLSVNLLYWFLTAPDPRFGRGIIYASAVFLVSVIISIPFQLIFKNKKTFSILAAVVLMMFLMVSIKIPYEMRMFSQELVDMPVLPTNEYVSKSGLKMRVPIQGDQVGNAELPSTPNPSNNIVLRKDGLGGGFRIVPR